MIEYDLYEGLPPTGFLRLWAQDRKGLRVRRGPTVDLAAVEARRWRVTQYIRRYWARSVGLIDALDRAGGVGYCDPHEVGAEAWSEGLLRVRVESGPDRYADPREGKAVKTWTFDWCGRDYDRVPVPAPGTRDPGADRAAGDLVHHWYVGAQWNGRKVRFDQVLDVLIRRRVERVVADRQYRFDLNGRTYWYVGSRAGSGGWFLNELQKLSWPDEDLEVVR